MPTICTNCVRFHFGECGEEEKNCYECGGYNHIERYCPNKRFIVPVSGEVLSGTRAWCEMHGLEHDPDLKFRVLQSLKMSPGAAILVNGVTIYPGLEKHLFSSEPPRGRNLKERVASHRFRSRSPIGHGRLSRSPPQERNRSPRGRGSEHLRQYPEKNRSRSPIRHARCRSRSPLRNTTRNPPQTLMRHQDSPEFDDMQIDYGEDIHNNSPRYRTLDHDEAKYAKSPRYHERGEIMVNKVRKETTDRDSENAAPFSQFKLAQQEKNRNARYELSIIDEEGRWALREVSNEQQFGRGIKQKGTGAPPKNEGSARYKPSSDPPKLLSGW